MNITLERPTRRRSLTRHCGPICLVDVLRRFGVERNVEQVSAVVVRNDPFGSRAARSHLLAAYARTCGLHAVTLQARVENAWQALQKLQTLDLTVILNHQATNARREGHFTILRSVDETSITIDDPFTGPGHRIDRENFLQLWQPNAESVGHVAIAICDLRGDQKFRTSRVDERRTGQASLGCPRCQASTALQPAALFNPGDWAVDGLWNCFYCSGCDGAFTQTANRPTRTA